MYEDVVLPDSMTVQQRQQQQQPERWLTSSLCIGHEKRVQPNKHYVYVILVSWSDGMKYPIYRRYTDFFDLYSCLQEEYKEIVGVIVPDLPALKVGEKGWLFSHREAVAEKRKRQITQFCEKLLKLDRSVLSCKTIQTFFDTWYEDYAQLPSSSNEVKSPRTQRKLSSLSADLTALWSLRKGSAPVAVVAPLVDNIKTNRRISHPTQALTLPISGIKGHKERSSSVDILERESNKTRTRGIAPRSVSEAEEEEETLRATQTHKAIYDYKKKRSGEVDLAEGTLVEVVEKSNTGWWFVQLEGGREEGWAPGAFLEPLVSMPQHTQPSIYDDVGIYQALEDYSGEDSDEVSYSKGEELHVVEANLDGWWKVRTSRNKEGYTPALNLHKSNDQSSMREFARKSANSKGPPPRKNSIKDDDSCPVYAKINKLNKKKLKENLTNENMENHPPSSSKKVEYTEVYIDKEGSNGGKPLLRRPTPVEYSDIVPLKLPSDKQNLTDNGRPKSDSPRFKIEELAKPRKSSSVDTNINETHVYENLSPVHKSAPKKEQTNIAPVAKYPLPTPRCKNISCDNIQLSEEAAASAEAKKPRPFNQYDNVVPPKLKSYTAGRNSPVSPDGNENNLATCEDFDWPAIPSLPSPKLPKDIQLPSSPSTVVDKPCPPQYVGAICDYCARQEIDRIVSFKTGDHGILLKRGSQGWWGVKIGKKKGWVPAAYWHILQERPPLPKRNSSGGSNPGSSAENSPKLERKPARIHRKRTPPLTEGPIEQKDTPGHGDFRTQAWFVGMISRQQSEVLLLTNGSQGDFLIRESTNRIGDFTLSVTYHSRVRHFPIQSNGENKFYIGKHNFDSLAHVIKYYKKHPLFFDEKQCPASLGNPVIH